MCIHLHASFKMVFTYILLQMEFLGFLYLIFFQDREKYRRRVKNHAQIIRSLPYIEKRSFSKERYTRSSGFLKISRKYHQLGQKKYHEHRAQNSPSQDDLHDEKRNCLCKEDRTNNEEIVHENIHKVCITVNWKHGPLEKH
jgi:hypothetical protein